MLMLVELVHQHVLQPHGSKENKTITKECTDWTAIGKQLNRIPAQCRNKWESIQASRMKKGPFTAQEDALIRQRVAEWGNKGKGLWVSLQQELGRSGRTIGGRWTRRLSKHKST